MPGNLEFEFRFKGARRRPGVEPGEDRPFRILALADLSGRGCRGGEANGGPLAERIPLRIDVDNFDAVFRRLAPRLRIPAPGGADESLAVSFEDLDGFHPDALFDRLEPFRKLRDTRKRLLDPETFPRAAAELKHESAPATAPDEGGPGAESDPGTLERLLGKRAVVPAEDRALEAPGVEAFIRGIVAPHVVPDTADEQRQLVSAVDQAVTDLMRSVLHAPAFQALESCWRSIEGLVTGLETGEELQVYVLDVSRDELADDVTAAGQDLERTDLHGLLVDRGIALPGAHPWSVLAGGFTFGDGPEDLRLLAALGAIASRCGGPFLAGASPSLLGCGSVGDLADPSRWADAGKPDDGAWRSLRSSAHASWIGLALPRILLRLPYGKRGEETERFTFEELGAEPDHGSFLWGDPAFGGALLLGRSFQEGGWSMDPGDVSDLEDLPAFVIERDGERVLRPGAEVLLGERAATAILERGLMPVLGRRDRNAARWMRFQSIADPPAPLSGPWA